MGLQCLQISLPPFPASGAADAKNGADAVMAMANKMVADRVGRLTLSYEQYRLPPCAHVGR